MSEMVERVARAICSAEGRDDLDVEDGRMEGFAEEAAKAAIIAMRDPTGAMRRWLFSRAIDPATYSAAIDEALKD